MKPTGDQVVATNRQARRNFELFDTFECGIVLRGSEVKSLRESKVQLSDAFAVIDAGEVWL
ncbi:MAG: SsrA-binding protein, partial [Microthrixaceae bacterium]